MICVLIFALTLALLLTGSTVDVPAQSEATPIKIGYAISRTGHFAPGAQVTQEPNYLLWAEQ
jgi:branched-chain amino acid transport system substrate-binding protein